MSFCWNFPLFTIILSLISSVLCTLLKSRAAKCYTVSLECLLIVMSASILWYTVSSGQACN